MQWGEKRWHFAAIVAPEALVTAAIVDLGYAGVAFAYAVDRKTGRHRRFELKTPGGWGMTVAEAPDQASRLLSPGASLLIDPAGGRLVIRLLEFQATLALEPGVPYASEWPIAGAGRHRTQKRMGDPMRGVLHLNGETRLLEGHGLIDWSRGQLARETSWRWAAGVGHTDDGRRVAWNLRTGFDDPKGLENALWIDGRPHPVGPATIEPGAAWTVAGGALDLRLAPEGEHREDFDVLLIASRYRQPWGAFAGTFEGRPITGYGVCEDHWARW